MSHSFKYPSSEKEREKDAALGRSTFSLKKMFSRPSKTRQDHANATDINVIVERYQRTGMMPPSRGVQPQYADVSELQGDITERLEFSRSTIDQVQADVRNARMKKPASSVPSVPSATSAPSAPSAPPAPPAPSAS